MKCKIYISGKIGDLPKHVYTLKFQRAETILLLNGWVDVVNPVKLDHSHHDGSWNNCMLEDIKYLFDCDAIYMLDNWQNSKGAKIERDIAIHMGKTVYYERPPQPLKERLTLATVIIFVLFFVWHLIHG